MTDKTLTVQSSFFCFQFGNQIKNWISGLVKIFNLMIEKLWPGLALELHDTRS